MGDTGLEAPSPTAEKRSGLPHSNDGSGAQSGAPDVSRLAERQATMSEAERAVLLKLFGDI